MPYFPKDPQDSLENPFQDRKAGQRLFKLIPKILKLHYELVNAETCEPTLSDQMESKNGASERLGPPPYVEIDIFDLFRYALGAWRFILVCTTLAIIMTACALRNAEPVYEADMIVAPADANDGGGSTSSQSLTSKVLNTLGGGGGGGGTDTRFDQFQFKMTSPSVIHAANKDGKLYEWIYPGMWNANTRTWHKPSGFGQFLVGMIRSFFGRPEWTAPDDVMTAEVLQKQILFEPIPKSTLTKITYQNKNPVIAKGMLSRLFTEADGQLRSAERARLHAQISNANAVLATTQVADFRQAMGQALANAEYRLMNVPDTIDYSANNVEAPFVSSLPVSPKIAQSLAIALLTSLLSSAFVAVAYQVALVELRRRGWSVSFARRSRREFEHNKAPVDEQTAWH